MRWNTRTVTWRDVSSLPISPLTLKRSSLVKCSQFGTFEHVNQNDWLKHLNNIISFTPWCFQTCRWTGADRWMETRNESKKGLLLKLMVSGRKCIIDQSRVWKTISFSNKNRRFRFLTFTSLRSKQTHLFGVVGLKMSS